LRGIALNASIAKPDIGHVGGGVSFDGVHILTCAHVVNFALGLDLRNSRAPDANLVICCRLHNASGGLDSFDARVERWGPTTETFRPSEDFCVLKLELPNELDFRKFALPASNFAGTAVDNLFYATQVGQSEFFWFSCQIVARVPDGLLQLRKDPEAPAPKKEDATYFRHGFSGSAGFSGSDSSFVGILQRMNRDGSEAFAIPTALLPINQFPVAGREKRGSKQKNQRERHATQVPDVRLHRLRIGSLPLPPSVVRRSSLISRAQSCLNANKFPTVLNGGPRTGKSFGLSAIAKDLGRPRARLRRDLPCSDIFITDAQVSFNEFFYSLLRVAGVSLMELEELGFEQKLGILRNQILSNELSYAIFVDDLDKHLELEDFKRLINYASQNIDRIRFWLAIDNIEDQKIEGLEVPLNAIQMHAVYGPDAYTEAARGQIGALQPYGIYDLEEVRDYLHGTSSQASFYSDSIQDFRLILENLVDGAGLDGDPKQHLNSVFSDPVLSLLLLVDSAMPKSEIVAICAELNVRESDALARLDRYVIAKLVSESSNAGLLLVEHSFSDVHRIVRRMPSFRHEEIQRAAVQRILSMLPNVVAWMSESVFDFMASWLIRTNDHNGLERLCGAFIQYASRRMAREILTFAGIDTDAHCPPNVRAKLIGLVLSHRGSLLARAEHLRLQHVACSLYEEGRDMRNAAVMHARRSENLRKHGQYLAAVQAGKSAVAASVNEPVDVSIIAAGALSDAQRRLGNYNEAIDTLGIVLSNIDRIKKKPTKASVKVLFGAGQAYRRIGHFVKAISLFEEAISIAEEIKDIHGGAVAQNNCAQTYMSAGMGKWALEIAQSAKDRMQPTNDTHRLALCQLSEAVAHMQLEDYSLADGLFLNCISDFEAVGDASMATTCAYHMFESLRRQEDWISARALLNTSISWKEQHTAPLANVIGAAERLTASVMRKDETRVQSCKQEYARAILGEGGNLSNFLDLVKANKEAFEAEDIVSFEFLCGERDALVERIK